MNKITLKAFWKYANTSLWTPLGMIGWMAYQATFYAKTGFAYVVLSIIWGVVVFIALTRENIN